MLADALASVRLDGYALGEVSGAARDDAGVCLAACGEAGGALQFCSARLRDDAKVVGAAVGQ